MARGPMLVAILLACFGVSAPSYAQVLDDEHSVDMMMDCAMHEAAGPWIPKDLRSDGMLRFNFLHEAPSGKDPQDPAYFDNWYFAFWNPSRTKGELLHFTRDKAKPSRFVTITNEGHILSKSGKLELDFFQGGEATRAEYMTRLDKLKATLVQAIAIGSVKRTEARCDSFLRPRPD